MPRVLSLCSHDIQQKINLPRGEKAAKTKYHFDRTIPFPQKRLPLSNPIELHDVFSDNAITRYRFAVPKLQLHYRRLPNILALHCSGKWTACPSTFGRSDWVHRSSKETPRASLHEIAHFGHTVHNAPSGVRFEQTIPTASRIEGEGCDPNVPTKKPPFRYLAVPL